MPSNRSKAASVVGAGMISRRSGCFTCGRPRRSRSSSYSDISRTISGTFVSGVTGQPSPSRAERRTPASFIAPIHSGGCGCCHGRMCVCPSWKDQNLPSKLTTSCVQSCRMIWIASSIIAKRCVKSMPNAVNSSSR